MYDLITQIISHMWSTGSNEQSTVYPICGAVIIILLVTFIDMIYRIIHFTIHRK